MVRFNSAVAVRLASDSRERIVATLEVDLDIATELAVLDRLLAWLTRLDVGGELVLDVRNRFIDVRGYSALERVTAAADRSGRLFGVVQASRSLRIMCDLWGPSSLLIYDYDDGFDQPGTASQARGD